MQHKGRIPSLANHDEQNKAETPSRVHLLAGCPARPRRCCGSACTKIQCGAFYNMACSMMCKDKWLWNCRDNRNENNNRLESLLHRAGHTTAHHKAVLPSRAHLDLVAVVVRCLLRMYLVEHYASATPIPIPLETTKVRPLCCVDSPDGGRPQREANRRSEMLSKVLPKEAAHWQRWS